jgi:hypothetical protein
MFKRINSSRFLLKLVERTSNLLAKQRGLPIVLGIVLVIIGFIFQLLNFSMENQTIELLGIITHNTGVLIALIGLVLSTPLGK